MAEGACAKPYAPAEMNMGGEIPEEIAISIAAEIITSKKGKLDNSEANKRKKRAKTLMKEWQDLGKEIRRYLNTETFPIVIKILKDEKEIPRWYQEAPERPQSQDGPLSGSKYLP